VPEAANISLKNLSQTAVNVFGKSKNVKIPLIDQHYQTNSTDQNARQLINMFVVPAQTESKFPMIAYPTPGLTTFCTTFSAGGEVRALHLWHNVAYVIIDDRFNMSFNIAYYFTNKIKNLSKEHLESINKRCKTINKTTLRGKNFVKNVNKINKLHNYKK